MEVAGFRLFSPHSPKSNFNFNFNFNFNLNFSHKQQRLISSSSQSHRHSSICSRRKLSIAIVSSSALNLPPLSLLSALASPQISELELSRYTDEKQGFTLLIPSTWIKVDKPGATLLFQQVNKGANNVGVVVSPVRLDSLPDFGTPQFVLHKLIQAEKRKESTKDVEAISVAERSGHGGLQVYEFEYKLDSTRGGVKRIFSAAFVASKKLYLLNITHSDKPEDPLDPSTESLLKHVLHSFDIASSI